jgi:ferredoxin-NADP reductase
MTSLQLVLWIAAGISLQVFTYLGFGFWRHWRSYQALLTGAAALDLPALPDPANEVDSRPAWAGLRPFIVESKKTEDTGAQVCSFYLVPEDGQALAEFRPGQFLTFRLDIAAANGDVNAVIRCYSLSDAPNPSHFRVSIKRAPAPAGSTFAPGISSNYFHDHVQVGSRLHVRAPSGHFYLDRSDAPTVLIGGGIGITPMLSMLNWCLANQPTREIWLFYGVRDSGELVMTSDLYALAKAHDNFHLHLCFSNTGASHQVASPGKEVHHHQSRVDVTLLRRLLPLKPYHFYICGPGPMLASLVPALEDWGVPDARIHFEAFGPASVRRKSAADAPAAAALMDSQAVVVSFKKSGKEISWQPGMGSLLDLAEANGVPASSGCRAGVCGSCQTNILAGEVTYTQVPDFDPEPGSCLLCVCTPKSAVTLEL